MRSKRESGPKLARPPNDLLRRISDGDFRLLASHLEMVELRAGHIIYNPGDAVDAVCFPCGAALVSFVVALEDGREVDVALIGHEGAAAGIINRVSSPAYSRIVVRFGGTFVRLPVARLDDVMRKSPTLKEFFARYGDALLAQAFQSIACNAAHSIEQRAAKWMIDLIDRRGDALVPLTHDQLAALLGVGRSYASRVIQSFRAQGILETRRGSFLITNRAALLEKACPCNTAPAEHLAELLDGKASAHSK